MSFIEPLSPITEENAEQIAKEDPRSPVRSLHFKYSPSRDTRVDRLNVLTTDFEVLMKQGVERWHNCTNEVESKGLMELGRVRRPTPMISLVIEAVLVCITYTLYLSYRTLYN